MAAKGRDFLVQIESSTPGTYETVGGLRTNSFSLNNEQVDISDKDGTAWKALLAQAGLQSISMKGSGVAKSSSTQLKIRDAAFSGAFVNLKLTSGLGYSFTGPFQVTSYEGSGDHNKEETFSVSLDSAGDIVYDNGD